jgi:formylglycine-generating enzyme required for sulfatase activity
MSAPEGSIRASGVGVYPKGAGTVKVVRALPEREAGSRGRDRIYWLAESMRLEDPSMRRSVMLVSLGTMLAVLAGSLTGLGHGAPAPQKDKPGAELATHQDYTETITGTTVRFRMVAVPGGTFRMGSLAEERGRRVDEGPQHWVRVGPFWMGRCEVTWDEFDLFKDERIEAKAIGHPVEDGKGADALSRPTPPYIDETWGFGREGYPVVGVTHHAAMEYCRWLSRRTGKKYRLPTEAEWEWACRADTRTAYSFGDDPAPLAEYAWYAKNSDESTHPVGLKKPNRWGLYDMYGNVAEWCLDHYDKDTYARLKPELVAVRPVVLPTERRFSHVARGGCWADDPPACRSAARRGSDRSWIRLDPQIPPSIWWLTNDIVGFRVVLAVEEQEELRQLRSKVTPKSK